MTICIIIVDDNEGERYLMSRSIEEAGISCEIHEFVAGDEFLEVFNNPTRFQSLIGPECEQSIILLDINMPRMTGFDVLEEMEKIDNAFKHFVVLMVTSSNSEEDKKRAQQYNFVKEFIIKPVDEDKIKTLVDKYPA